MKIALLTFVILIFSFSLFSQEVSRDNRIVVLGEGRIEVPANSVQFTVSLNGIDSLSMDSAYNNYKNLEEKLLAIFSAIKIPINNIKFNLPSFSKRFNYESKKKNFYCEQNVNFSFDSVMLTPKIQELLVKSGFDNFNCQFTLKDVNKYKHDMLEKAVQVGKEKAATLANVSGRKIKRIVKVMDTEESDPRMFNYSRDNYNVSGLTGAVAGLMHIPQSISVSVTVKVVFELE